MSTEELAAAHAAVAAATTSEEQATANAALAAVVASMLAAVPAEQSPSLSTGPYHERYKLARQQVPSFSGKPDYSSESLLVKIKAAIDTYAINPKDWVDLTLSCLDGRATEFQTELVAEAKVSGTGPLTFEVLEQRLKQRFPVATEESPQYIMCHKLAPGSNMAHFISLFNQQVSRAGIGEPANQALLQEVFLSKLGKDLRLAVEQSRPESGWTGLPAVQAATARAHNTLHLRGAQPTSSNSSQGSGQQAKRPNRGSGPPAKRSRLASDTKWCTHHETNTHDTAECHSLKHHGAGRGGGRSGGRGFGRQASKN